jgi:hypothetical protein
MKLITFDKPDVVTILSKLGIRYEAREMKTVIINENGQVAKCEICDKELSIDNLGNIAKGSNKLFCDNPACFTAHLAKKFS